MILMKKERNELMIKKGKDRIDAAPDTTTIRKLTVNFDTMKRALETGRRVSKEDWMEWLRKLSIELLKVCLCILVISILSLLNFRFCNKIQLCLCVFYGLDPVGWPSSTHVMGTVCQNDNCHT